MADLKEPNTVQQLAACRQNRFSQVALITLLVGLLLSASALGFCVVGGFEAMSEQPSSVTDDHQKLVTSGWLAAAACPFCVVSLLLATRARWQDRWFLVPVDIFLLLFNIIVVTQTP